MHTFSIVIPTFNGRHLLEKHLPSVVAHTKGFTDLIIVDDGGEDDTKNYLEKNFPQAIYIKNEKNLGFVKSVNRGFAAAKSDLVILLNNDVQTLPGYLRPVLDHFSDPKVFAVTLNETSSSWPQVTFNGKIQFVRGEDKTKARYSAWASGGSAIFSKKIWDQLGGLNEVYSPGYWEDMDLGWRGWKSGYKIIWEPESKIEHQHESTFKKLNPQFISLVKQRNELLFNWQNITDSDLGQQHCSWLIKYTLAHPGYLKVVWEAVKHCGNLRQSPRKLSDHQVLELVNQPL